jgi:hypothetical protein
VVGDTFVRHSVLPFPADQPVTQREGADMSTDQGKTTIADAVVSKTAGLAARVE